MALENEKDKKEPIDWYFFVCPKCKNKVETDRRYCACGTDLNHQPLHKQKSIDPPDMLKLKNLDIPSAPCDSCMGNCSYCASFSVKGKNSGGWGGTDCEHKQNHIMCTCCWLMIERQDDTPGINNAIAAALKGKDNILANRYSGNPNLSQNYKEAV